jgi:16S rRNA (cytosine967-C5)-methyltransferase
MQTIQQAAVNVVSQVMSGRNLTQVLKEITGAQRNLTAQQKGALQDISYGTLRYFGQLERILDALLSKPLQDMSIRYLLLVALYQLQHTKAAEHAVVDHAVSAIRKRNPAASGLVNAVLRNYLRKKDQLNRIAEQTEQGRYSYPQWWIDAVKAQYGEQADRILITGNQHPPMTLRVNKRRTTVEGYLQLLADQGIPANIIEPGAVMLERALAVDRLPGFFDGLVSVQDAGAQYAAKLLEVADGMRVLDACAAPGGKSAHLLESEDIQLIALDKDEQRMQRVRENMQRLQLQAEIVVGDAANPQTWWDGKRFQRILADVPCSASGVVRRHPDIKWLRRPSDIESFAQQQQQILQALWPLLEADGKLLYATCSIFARENQLSVSEFLSKNADARQVPITMTEIKQGQILPNDRHDGFFYALLHKHA